MVGRLVGLVLVVAAALTALPALAQEFGGTGRAVLFGFGDTTAGLQRDAETFGFAGRGFPGHVGIDIAAPPGTPVFAATAGEVTSPGPATREAAHEVVILGEAASDLDIMSYEFVTDIQVVAGERVLAGQLLGYVAAEHSEVGPAHLHFGIADARGRRLFDPVPLLLDATGRAECVDPVRGRLSPREGGYESNRARRVRMGGLDVPALLFPVGCDGV